MSVPLVLIGYSQAEAAYSGTRLKGNPPKARAFTLRISGDKEELRNDLDRMFGLRHRSLFPDLPGFAQYGETF
jgi:hypothetical protein